MRRRMKTLQMEMEEGLGLCVWEEDERRGSCCHACMIREDNPYKAHPRSCVYQGE